MNKTRPQEIIAEMVRYGQLRSETGFRDLQVARIIGELSGMIRKIKGRYVVTKGCQQLQARSGLAEIYPRLFRTFVSKFNWAYADRLPPAEYVQNTYGFTLYLLSLYGDGWRPPSFYEDLFLKAYPHLLYGFEGESLQLAEKQIRYSQTFRAFEKLDTFLGIVETKTEKVDFISRTIGFRKTKLFDDLVRFHIQSDAV